MNRAEAWHKLSVFGHMLSGLNYSGLGLGKGSWTDNKELQTCFVERLVLIFYVTIIFCFNFCIQLSSRY